MRKLATDQRATVSSLDRVKPLGEYPYSLHQAFQRCVSIGKGVWVLVLTIDSPLEYTLTQGKVKAVPNREEGLRLAKDRFVRRARSFGQALMTPQFAPISDEWRKALHQASLGFKARRTVNGWDIHMQIKPDVDAQFFDQVANAAKNKF